MLRTVQYSGGALAYELTVKPVKNMNLRVVRGQAALSVNRGVPLKAADAFVLSKAEWILQCLQKQSAAQPAPRAYVDGERFTLLGRRLSLRVERGVPGASINGECLLLLVKNPADYAEKQRVTARFVDTLCRDVFLLLLQREHALLAPRVPMPQLRVRSMKSQWGSCLCKKRVVTLSRALIQAPVACIEYVALHELVHLLQPNHSKAFYNEVATLMPDYKARVAALKAYAPAEAP